MNDTVGGSELSAIEGTNPYSKFHDVVKKKVGLDPWTGGSASCWWGTMFEDVAARVIELDCGVEIKGAEICVQMIRNHRNSPDGYSVAGAYYDAEGALQLCEVDADGVYTTAPTIYIIVMWELKCPAKRRPDGTVYVPYRSQLWSGLAVSPLADVGIYVDSVIRKCTLAELGPNPSYDNIYHRDGVARGSSSAASAVYTSPPYAWGLIAVYAPRPDAPEALRMSPPDAAGRRVDVAQEVREMKARLLKKPIARCEDALIDFGAAYFKPFEAALLRINQKYLPIVPSDPNLHGGRGAALTERADIDAAVAAMRTVPEGLDRAKNGTEEDAHDVDAREHYYLLGYIPWKMMNINYVPEHREPGYHKTIAQLSKRVFDEVAVIRQQPDVQQGYNDFLERIGVAPPRSRRKKVDDSALCALFD